MLVIGQASFNFDEAAWVKEKHDGFTCEKINFVACTVTTTRQRRASARSFTTPYTSLHERDEKKHDENPGKYGDHHHLPLGPRFFENLVHLALRRGEARVRAVHVLGVEEKGQSGP